MPHYCHPGPKMVTVCVCVGGGGGEPQALRLREAGKFRLVQPSLPP